MMIRDTDLQTTTEPGMNYIPCYQQPFVSIFNSDCLELLSNIESETVDMVFADPPFNVGIKYKGYKDNNLGYKEWCEQWIAECFRVLKPTGTFYLMTIDRHLEWKMPIMAKYGSFINLVKWKNVSANHVKNRFWNATQPIMVYGKTENYKFRKVTS